ncbi:hydroxypyruvate isomerase [Solidesulfovibrio sp.]|uniref:hydroxypyruvate isomerase n=1 Tax=Solidesulfovibrio sp. TaxID=2910990 RepID=UPI00260F8499|nr:hydroxypyruvate isomerase [Solidesulfovibrio sp.]
MPRLAANVTMLFTELLFPDRFAAAKKAGFRYVEYLFPYDYPAEELRGLLDDNGLTQVLFNLPCGDWAAGERGIAGLPGREAEFRDGVARGLEYAEALGVARLNCLAGKLPEGVSPRAALETLVANVSFAADALAAKGLTLVVEAINRCDMPGFMLNRTAQVMALLDSVRRPNAAMQYDVYHAQREEGELVATIAANLARIGHIQVADNPGRHQPGTGEINYPFLFAELDRLGYDGFVGLEYVPAPDTLASLTWIPAMGLTL